VISCNIISLLNLLFPAFVSVAQNETGFTQVCHIRAIFTHSTVIIFTASASDLFIHAPKYSISLFFKLFIVSITPSDL
jgi:hypothetical protein